MRGQRQREQVIAGKVGTGFLAATVCWATLAIGGVPSWAVVGLTLLALSGAAINVFAARFRADAGVAVLLGLALYTALQSLFVPLGWIQWFDSNIHQTWARTGELVGNLRRATLSLEPFTTRLEVLKLVSYAAIWGGVSARARETSPVHLARWVVWVAIGVFALVFLHRASGLQRVYGVYEGLSGQTRAWVGPLLNPNNLAGLCNLGAFCAVACSTPSERHPSRTPAYLLMASVLAAMSALTGSRGAVLALVVGVLLLGLSWMRLSRPQAKGWQVSRVSSVGLGIGLVAAFFALAATDETANELGNLSLSKLKILELGFGVFTTHPWWGIGRGAFGAEAGTEHGLAQAVVFTYVENFVLEWLVGWGVFVGGLALTAVGVGVARIRGGFRTRVLKIGLGVVLLQNLVDLGLELPGLAVPWLVVFAACWGGSSRRTWALPPFRRPVSLVPVALLGLMWISLPPGDVARVDRARVAAARNAPDYEARLAAALRLHPGDAFLLRLGAVRAAERGDRERLAWLNAALLRAPHDGRTHLVLAEVLRNEGRTPQALLSLRAAAADRALHSEVIRRVLAWAPERLLEVIPDGETGVSLLATMSGAVKDLEQRRKLLLQAKERAPNDWWVTNLLIETDIARVAARTAECDLDRAGCLRRISEGIAELERVPAAARSLRVLRGQEMLALGNPQAAYEHLVVSCERRPSDQRCLTTLLQAARQLDDNAWRQAATAYLDGVCRGGDACLQPRMTVAAEFDRRRDWASALETYSTATSMATTPDAHLGASRAAHRLGRQREALHWLIKAERRFDDAKAIERIHQARQNLGS